MEWAFCVLKALHSFPEYLLVKSYSIIAGLYNAAGSLMVIMVWVFYASLIIMFGAVFTYTRIKLMGEKIPPSDYAVKIEKNKNLDLETQL